MEGGLRRGEREGGRQRPAVQGTEPPEVASLLSNLGVYYAMQGNLPKAGGLFQRALAVQEKVLGPNHPDVARSLNNLAGTWIYQNQPDKAEPLHRRALAIFTASYNPDHPGLRRVRVSYARMLKDAGRPGEARAQEGNAHLSRPVTDTFS